MDQKKVQYPRRIHREKKTLRAMLRIYCRAKHGMSAELCPECQSLLTYAEERIGQCPFLPEKPSCAKCPVHCYAPGRRDEIRRVMRYSGPRMLLRHPFLTLLHSLDEVRYKPSALPHRRNLSQSKKGEN
jgi:hypothetical protein